jgi:hypothetical protein
MPNNYGALGATFQLARPFQGISLIAIIGMTANFIAEIVNNNATPPNVFIGTITVVCHLISPCQSVPAMKSDKVSAN